MERFLSSIVVILFIFNMLSCSSIPHSDEQIKDTKQVIVSNGDTLVKAQILLSPPDIKLKNNLEYYWYYSDAIRSNKGGYTGNLLHGSYIAIHNSKKLLVKGTFKNGLKNGDWKVWYPNGSLHFSQCWDKGVLDGKQEVYTENNSLKKVEFYKKGKLHGDVIEFYPDTTINTKFRNGEKVDNNNHKENKISRRAEKKKPIKGNDENIGEAEIKDKNSVFQPIKSFFNSKKDTTNNKIKQLPGNKEKASTKKQKAKE